MPQVSKTQVAVLFVNILIPTAHIQVLISAVKYSKQDAWLITFGAYLLVAGLTWICLKLIEYYPRKNILEFSSQLLGDWLGKIVALILFIYSFLVAVYMLEQFTSLMSTMVYDEMPKYVFAIGIMLLVLYAVSLGIEVVCRVSDILFIGVILVLIIIGSGISPNLNFNYLFPIFTQDIKSLIKGGLTPAAFFGQIIFILFFHNLITDHSGLKRIIHSGLFIGMLFVLSFVIVEIAIFGVQLGSKFLFPPYMIIRQVNIPGVLGRIESVMVTLWIGLSFLEIAVFFWISNLSLAKLSGLNNGGIIKTPLAILLIVFVSQIWQQNVNFQEYLIMIYILIIFIIEFSIPTILFSAAIIKGEKGSNNE